MEAIFYENFKKRLKSTKQPTGGTTLEIKLKDGVSLLSPVFILDSVNYNINYCKWNNRYYFVDNVVPIANTLAEYHCTLDELATYKADIAAYNGFVERSASNIDALVNDPMISQKQEIISMHSAATVFEDNLYYEPDNGAYFLRIINNQSSSITGISTYVISAANFASIMQDIFTLTSYDSEEFLTGLYKDITKALFNPGQYLVDCYWLPVYAGVMTTTKPLVAGFYNLDQEFLVADKVGHTFNIDIEIPTNYYTDFRAYNSRWTNLTIWVPGIGQFDIDPINLSNDATLSLILAVDYTTGDVVAQLVRNDTHIITTKYGSWKVPIQIGNGGSVVNNVAGGLISTASSAALGNVLGVASGAAGTISNMLTPPAHAVGSVGSRQQFIAEFANIQTTLTNYGSTEVGQVENGKPLYKNVVIGTLSGYVKCANASVPIAADASEIDAVNSALNSGFYFE